jgi:hypothetical protein
MTIMGRVVEMSTRTGVQYQFVTGVSKAKDRFLLLIPKKSRH